MAKKSTVKKAAKKTVKKTATISVTKRVKKSTKTAVKKPTRKAAEVPTAAMLREWAKKRTSRYISYVPKTIPEGKILCHNGMIPQTPDQKPGFNGFRAWVDNETQSAKYGPCNCGWSGFPHHMTLSWLEGSRKKYDARKFPRK